MIGLLVVLSVTTPAAMPPPAPVPVVCPASPSDPPWRWMTCYMLVRMGEPSQMRSDVKW